MDIIKFKDGKYGIRKGHDPYYYKDLNDTNPSHWWYIKSTYIEDCKTDAIEKVRKMFPIVKQLDDELEERLKRGQKEIKQYLKKKK